MFCHVLLRGHLIFVDQSAGFLDFRVPVALDSKPIDASENLAFSCLEQAAEEQKYPFFIYLGLALQYSITSI